ncbi:MAG: putative sugar nucleotidyl transferase [Phycisphaerales bacterium]
MAITTIIFDDGKGLLSPLTDLRPAFCIRTGAFTTLERLQRLSGFRIVGWESPEQTRGLIRELVSLPCIVDVLLEQTCLVLNGRCPLPPADLASLPLGSAVVEQRTGDLIAAHVEPGGVAAAARSETSGLSVTATAEHVLIGRPWQVRTFRDACISHDLKVLVGCAGGRNVVVSPTAKVHPTVVLDDEAGPIVIGDHAVVRPGAIICGPAFIGSNTTVLDRCLIKPNSAIGPACKVAGEIGGTIFQGYANKAHDGHLGDSYVGEWANLGAGTTNSNLLNTYGEVIARPFGADGSVGGNERTGERFLGTLIGDHTKLAICTRIMTGAIIGTGTMWAASAPVSSTIAPFSWVTDSGTRTYALRKFSEVMETVMARRNVTPGPAYLEAIEHLHRTSADSRL